MKALTIKQPYASLIMAGVKHYETRSWQWLWCTGKLAIHAAKTDAKASDRVWEIAHKYLGDDLSVLPRGAVLGTVRVKDCYYIGGFIEARTLTDPEEMALGNYIHGWYMWELDNVHAFDNPIPAKGKQKLWDWEG